MSEIRKEIKVIIPIFISFFLLYFLTISRCFSLAIDSATYAADIANGMIVFHPHHLIYHAVFYFWNKLLTSFGSNNMIINITSINVLFGALSCVILYLIFKIRFGISTAKSLLLLCMPAFSFGLWIVSTSVNVYTAPVLFLLLIFYYYLSEEETKLKWVLIGVFHSLAVIFNEWNVFIFFVILLSILLFNNRKLILKKYFIYYFFTFLIFTGLSYLLIMIFYYHLYNYNDMHSWMTSYSRKFPWSPLSLKTIAQTLVGIGQTIITPFWLLNSPAFLKIISKILPASVSLDEELFFARHFSIVEIIIFLLFTLIIVGLLLYYVVIAFKEIRSTYYKNKKPVTYLVLWIIIPSIMPFFWSSQNQRYWFIQVIVFFILIGLIISKNNKEKQLKRHNYVGLVLVISLFIVNLFGTMIKGTDMDNDLNYCKVKGIASEMSAGDLVIYKNIYNLGSFINFYYPGSKELKIDSFNDKEHYDFIVSKLSKIDSTLYTNKVYILEEIIKEKDKMPKEIKKLIDDIEIRYESNMTFKDFGYGMKAYIIKKNINKK